MMNVKEYKTKLRRELRAQRKAMAPDQKLRLDHRIAQRVHGLFEYESADTIIAYVSMDIEVGTQEIIDTALEDGKRVLVPRCVEGTRLMEFYEIKSRSELVEGSYGILEPEKNSERLVTDFGEKSLCIIPALAGDHRGYRLGYGGGYYDRFLSGYTGTKVLILYQNCLLPRLWQNRYDVPVDVIVTERLYKRIVHTKRGTEQTGPLSR